MTREAFLKAALAAATAARDAGAPINPVIGVKAALGFVSPSSTV